MKVYNTNKSILFITTISFLSALLIFQNSVNSQEKSESKAKQESITAKRASKTQGGINFCLTVIPGDKTQKTFAIVTITNTSDKEVVVPTPQVMPLAGTLGYKNTIQIRKRNDELLDITGIHMDSFERPVKS